MVSADGRELAQQFSIAAGERLGLSLTVPQGGDDLTWLWVVLGVAVAGGVAAVTTVLLYEPDVQQPIVPDLGVVMTELVGR